MCQVALLHELKEDPDALIVLEHIFTCDNVLTIQRFDQTAFVDNALAFGVAYTSILEHALVLISGSNAFKNRGEGTAPDLFLYLVEILRVELLHNTCFLHQPLDL